MSTATIERPATQAPVTAVFRRNAQKEWVIFGPEDVVVEGPVHVLKKNGKFSVENVLGVGGSFVVDGVRCRYGYLKPKAEEPKPTPVPSSSEYEGNFAPDDLGDDLDGAFEEDEHRTRVDATGRTVPDDF